MPRTTVRIIRHWDSIPPVVIIDGDEPVSLRVLESRSRKMEQAIRYYLTGLKLNRHDPEKVKKTFEDALANK